MIGKCVHAVCHVQCIVPSKLWKAPTKIWTNPEKNGKTNALNFICECERFKMHNSLLHWLWLCIKGSISFHVILWWFVVYFKIRGRIHKHSRKIYLFSLKSNAERNRCENNTKRTTIEKRFKHRILLTRAAASSYWMRKLKKFMFFMMWNVRFPHPTNRISE